MGVAFLSTAAMRLFLTKSSTTEAIHVSGVASASTASSIGMLVATVPKPRNVLYTSRPALWRKATTFSPSGRKTALSSELF